MADLDIDRMERIVKSANILNGKDVLALIAAPRKADESREILRWLNDKLIERCEAVEASEAKLRAVVEAARAACPCDPGQLGKRMRALAEALSALERAP